ncbi:EnvZ/OmpR regulon moderator MzrA [Salmonella enterica]|nr:EnvZ/OmpR regulon moderator MzrA [Salmonella enterica]EJF5585942.1 EnvZ/OmpR regulon moderator MzrA [Salmonella enterica]EJF5939357.1 EnvZ/OmpR regulon moderator MzrA [Salmonella enterica]EJF6133176.1 EnvZ/OmpR regulon moderator MzrA [Salmonella enterica]
MLKPRITARQLIWISAFLLMLTILMMTWSTLAIRAVNQGASMPDGFSVLHHLDANGIHFKSITPKNDMLLITFDSPAQSAAAKTVLDQTLPHGYVVAQQDDDNETVQWLSRLRESSHRFG